MNDRPSVAPAVPRAVPRDEVLPTSRWLALFIIPFLVGATAILWIRPHETGRLFAWPMDSPMTALLLGSAYVGGIWFFVRVFRAREWHRVKIGFLPVATFSSLLGVTTVLHWASFTHGHVSFWAWAVLYFTAPPLVLAAWIANRGEDDGRRAAGDPLLPRAVRSVVGALGVLTGALAALLFIAPEALIPHWPWTLGPLTARVVAAIVAMQGVALVGIAIDGRWSVAKVMFEAQLLTTPLIALAVLRSQSEFAAQGASAPAWAAGMVAAWLVTLGLYLVMQRRAR